MGNAQDSENYSTNGPICNSKAWSSHISGEGAEQEPIAAYRTRDRQAKNIMCPSEVQYSKANEIVQEELMSLHGVLHARMNIVLIVRCRRAIAIEKSIAKRGS
jgi:hypothetical protein